MMRMKMIMMMMLDTVYLDNNMKRRMMMFDTPVFNNFNLMMWEEREFGIMCNDNNADTMSYVGSIRELASCPMPIMLTYYLALCAMPNMLTLCRLKEVWLALCAMPIMLTPCLTWPTLTAYLPW